MQLNAAVMRLNGGKIAVCSGLVPYHCGVMWCSFYVFISKCIVRPGPSSLWILFKHQHMLQNVELNPFTTVWEGFQWTVWHRSLFSVFPMRFVSVWVWEGDIGVLTFCSSSTQTFLIQSRTRWEGTQTQAYKVSQRGTSHHTVCRGHRLWWC